MEPSTPRSWRHLVIAAGLILLTIGLSAGAVAAQDDTAAVRGTLFFENDAGERVPVPEVEITVNQTDDGEIFSAVTDAEGGFEVEVPAGSYEATIAAETLPEGVALRNPDRATLSFDLAAGQSRTLLFPLVEGDGTIATPRTGGASTLDSAIRLAWSGLKFGLIIAMSSIGLSLIFGTTGLTNFAHGELVTFGAIMAFLFNVTWGVHLLIAAPLAVLAAAAFGGANDRFIWRPLRHRGTGLVAMLVISIGLSILLRYIFLYQFGGFRQTYDQYQLQTSGYTFGPLTIVNREIATIVISVVALVLVALGLQKTRFGKAMRAVSDNRDLAESSGIDVERVILLVWIAGGALAGIGGILFGLDQQLQWDMGFELLLLMFAAVVLGGLGTAYGALVGGIVVGLFIQLSTLVVAPELKNIGALVVLVVILLFRPQGILGQRERIG